MRRFGPYTVEVVDEGRRATIRREDGEAPQPEWYELQAMKCMAFGSRATAVEIFPDARRIVDGQNQRHLWVVDPRTVPDLSIPDGAYAGVPVPDWDYQRATQVG